MLDQGSGDESFESEEFLSSQGSEDQRATRRSLSSSKKINKYVTDDDFKANYSPVILQKQSTLVLKTSFHLINYILMGLCQVFENIKAFSQSSLISELNDELLSEKKSETRLHKIDV